LGGRGFSSEGDDVLSSNDDKAESSLDLFQYASFFGFSDSVFVSIGENDVHVFVECKKSTDHHPSVLDGYSDSEINPLEELASLSCDV
jgi:hypothetical protein